MHIAVVGGTLHGLLQDEKLAVGGHGPVAVGQSVGHNGLCAGHHIGFDELSPVGSRARGQQGVLSGHPLHGLAVGAYDGVLAQVSDGVKP